MKCSNCGNELNPGAQFCTNCGAQVSAGESNLETNDVSQQNSNDTLQASEPQVAEQKNDTPVNMDNSELSEVEPVSEPTDNPVHNEDGVGGETDMNNEQPEQNINSNSEPSKVSNVTNTPVSKKKNMLLIILIAVVAVATVSVLGFVVYFKGITKPKSIFVKVLDNVANVALSPVQNKQNKVSESISFSSNIKTSDSSANEILDILNKLSFSIDTTLDYGDKKISGKFLINYDNNKLIQADVYAENNQIYLYSSDLYDKYIKVPYDYSELMNRKGSQISSYKDIIEEVKKSLEVGLKDSYFTSSRENIIINGKEIKTTKNELSLNRDNIIAIEKDVLTYLVNSQKYTSALSKLSGSTEQQIKDSLFDQIDQIGTQQLNINDTILIDIYTQGLKNEFVKASIRQQNNNMGSIELVKTGDNSYELQIIFGTDNIKANLIITEQDDKKVYNVNYSDGSNTVELNIGYSESYDKNVVKPDISNAVDMNSISESDLNGIMAKLQSNRGYTSIVSDIEKISIMGALDTYSSVDSSSDLWNGSTIDSNYDFDADSATFNF